MAVVGVVWVLGAIVVIGLGAWVALAGLDRYSSHGRTHPSALQPTTEMFVDPETGRRMRVWFDPTTGTREYREE